jgi:hypothetical protein
MSGLSPPEQFIARFLARVPPDVAGNFTPDQLIAIRRAFGMRYEMAHLLDIRRYLRLPWGRFYLVVLFGRDYRR